MTKANFLWCLARTKGTVRLRLRHDGVDWGYAMHITLFCVAAIAAPRRDKNGNGIRCLRKKTFVVFGAQGGTLLDNGKNARCRERADKALQKYSRWAREALGDRFSE